MYLMQFRTVTVLIYLIFNFTICVAGEPNYKNANIQNTSFTNFDTSRNDLGSRFLNNTSSNCFDTSRISYIINDSLFFYSSDPISSADGNFLMTGVYVSSFYNNVSGGYLIKLDHRGNVLWHRIYNLQNTTEYLNISYSKVLELKDGSILLSGTTNSRVTGNDNIIFTKTDNQGNIIWSKIYKSRLWLTGGGSSAFYYIKQMNEDVATGHIYITGPIMNEGRSLIKLNSANGNIEWAKAYNGGVTSDNPIGMDIKSDKIMLFSNFYNNGLTFTSITEINKTSGDTMSVKFWKSNDTSLTKVDFVTTYPLTVLNNGNYILTGKSFGNYIYPPGITPYYQVSLIELDSSLNIIRAYALRNRIESNSTVMSTYPDGKSIFKMYHQLSPYVNDEYIIQLMDGQIIKQRVNRNITGSLYNQAPVKAPDGGDFIIGLIGRQTDGINKIECRNIHPSDTSSSCFGINDSSAYLYPFKVIPTQSFSGNTLSNIFEETTNQNIVSNSITNRNLYGCIEVSKCDSFKLKSSATLLCPSQPQSITITGKKNIGCGSYIIWKYNTNGISDALRLNDSTLQLTFNSAWSGYVYGSISGCTLITDSIFINVIKPPLSFNLGSDFTICEGNTKLLNAHSGFVSYEWQDGSSDSTFLVTQPGTYFVVAKDGCGGIFRDTVNVLAHEPVTFSIGNDRIKCNNDTLMLQAPSGFISYNWSPNYNINSINTMVVTVNPTVDTSYILKVEAEPGCFGFDTIRIKVFNSPAINLGDDVSFCHGESITLLAGPESSNYNWNTGSTDNQITVTQAGIYIVIGTTLQGCKSFDTLKVLQVYNNPVVLLEQNINLCEGKSATLDAGLHAEYLWQNGTTNRTLIVNDLGIYNVTVKDINGCKGIGTSSVNAIHPLPQNFLPDNLSKCIYESITLKPGSLFERYLWNNNSTSAAITITQSGIYWLEVIDNNDCKGRDSINVTQKQCLKGLFVPNAFTPNADGKNDELKALLYGVIKQFKFSIYNRYGQLIFSTTNTNEGWNGIYKGIKQRQGAFVWKCQYHLEGEFTKEEHGTFILLR